MYRVLFAAMLLVVLAAPALAHPVPFSFLDLQLSASGMDASLVAHDFDLAHDLGGGAPERFLNADFLAAHAASIRMLLASRLHLRADGVMLSPEWSAAEVLEDRQSVRFNLHFPAITAMPAHVVIEADLFPYDAVHQTFVNIYENGNLVRQLILDHSSHSAEHFTGSKQSATAVIRRFLPEGIHHILIGPDHILFLIGLLLLGGKPRRLLMVVTAFTIAHSITLSLAALQIFNPPARIIEPAIALSIVYVGFDNLLVRQGRDVRAWIAFAFGFIHGFGFANVLRQMELPRAALGWSLLSFNVGVEIGQLIVVVAVASLLAAIRMRSKVAAQRIAVFGSIVVIVAGGFWFIERVFFPGGL